MTWAPRLHRPPGELVVHRARDEHCTWGDVRVCGAVDVQQHVAVLHRELTDRDAIADSDEQSGGGAGLDGGLPRAAGVQVHVVSVKVRRKVRCGVRRVPDLRLCVETPGRTGLSRVHGRALP